MTEREQALKTLWRERIHLDPNALTASPRDVQSRFETAWHLVEAYLHLLSPLPAGLLNWWLGQPSGHIVISTAPSMYHPGVHPWRGQSYTNVAHIATRDLVGSGKGAFLVSMLLLDHLLGGGAEQDQAYFSRGFGLSPDLVSAARRFVSIEQLHYGHVELNTASAGDYLAETLWLALYDSQTLNRIDPLLVKLYQQSLLSERFWSRQIRLSFGSSLPVNRTPEPR